MGDGRWAMGDGRWAMGMWDLPPGACLLRRTHHPPRLLGDAALEDRPGRARRGPSQSSTHSRRPRPATAPAPRRTMERPFARLYETGGMRPVHLRGHANIRKRLLIHTAGFNLGLLMRQLIGVGTQRGLQGRLNAAVAALLVLIRLLCDLLPRHERSTPKDSRSSVARSRNRRWRTSACDRWLSPPAAPPIHRPSPIALCP